MTGVIQYDMAANERWCNSCRSHAWMHLPLRHHEWCMYKDLTEPPRPGQLIFVSKPKEKPLMVNVFQSKRNGDPLRTIADTLSALTYDEMCELAAGFGVEPAKLNSWAKNYGAPQAAFGVLQSPGPKEPVGGQSNMGVGFNAANGP